MKLTKNYFTFVIVPLLVSIILNFFFIYQIYDVSSQLTAYHPSNKLLNLTKLLDYSKQEICDRIISKEYSRKFWFIPPLNIPSSQISEYTLNGKVSWSENYYKPYEKIVEHYTFTESDIEHLVKEASENAEKYYGKMDKYLYDSLGKYEVKGKNVLVFGSQMPWYEAIALSRGAKSVTTIEFQRKKYRHPKIKVFTVDDWVGERKSKGQFIEYDAVFVISSFEHAGLGRYYDPLHPYLDLISMIQLKCYIKDNALLYFTVPIGKDHLYWNAHRKYGTVRFPLLLSGWTVIESFGMKLEYLNTKRNDEHQPVFVAMNSDFRNMGYYFNIYNDILQDI